MKYGERTNVNGREMSRRQRIDLGLAVGGLSLLPGESRTLEEIAAFCDCSRQAIQQIEKRAMRKVRQALGTIVREDKE